VLQSEVVAPIESLTATSIMGWGGFVFGLIACAILVWEKITGRTKSIVGVENKLDHLCGQIEDMEGKLEVVDGLADSVRELTQEWRGVSGDNGYRSMIKDDHRRIDAIEKRNDIIDALKEARDEDDRRSGGLHRRKFDRELNNLLPEEREEKG
jgi:hypothetical protein